VSFADAFSSAYDIYISIPSPPDPEPDPDPGVGALYPGPCEIWPIEWCNCNLSGASPAATGQAALAATEVLWALSGRRFGVCQVTVRPCRDECEQTGIIWPAVDSYPFPTLLDGSWYNVGCLGGCVGACSCNTVSQFTLPGPVDQIVQIVIGDEIVPTGSYRLDSARFVVRTDGGNWPVCNDLSKSSGPGTWRVTYRAGLEVPMLGQMAAAELACEFLKKLSGLECKLPSRVTNISRQGVSMTLLDPQDFLTEGRIGLYLSDLFIKTFNPNHLASRSRVYSPDVRGPRVLS